MRSEVLIRKVANGFIVRVGCKEFVASTWSELSNALALYWTDPGKAAEIYINKD